MAGTQHGELLLTLIPQDGAPGLLLIDRADPRILVSEHLMQMLLRDECHPDVHLDGQMDNARLTVDAVNGRVIYCIRERVPEAWAWLAEWPD